jgi:Fe-S cluster assembly scaffold protein SufB
MYGNLTVAMGLSWPYVKYAGTKLYAVSQSSSHATMATDTSKLKRLLLAVVRNALRRTWRKVDHLTKPLFEGMAECTFCESGTFEPVEIFYSKTGYVTYCRRCWGEFGKESNESAFPSMIVVMRNAQPVDNSEDTPK